VLGATSVVCGNDYYLSFEVITAGKRHLRADVPIDEVVATMERHRWDACPLSTMAVAARAFGPAELAAEAPSRKNGGACGRPLT
jgi:hypothetical protein